MRRSSDRHEIAIAGGALVARSDAQFAAMDVLLVDRNDASAATSARREKSPEPGILRAAKASRRARYRPVRPAPRPAPIRRAARRDRRDPGPASPASGGSLPSAIFSAPDPCACPIRPGRRGARRRGRARSYRRARPAGKSPGLCRLLRRRSMAPSASSSFKSRLRAILSSPLMLKARAISRLLILPCGLSPWLHARGR